MLEVRVYAGHSLPLPSPYGAYHPTVSVQVGHNPPMYTPAIAAQPNQPRSASPEFNQVFYFPVQWPVASPQEYLYVRVHDLSPQNQVVTLGYIWFSLKDIDPNRSAESWFPLLDSRSGSIRVGIIPHPRPMTQLQYPTGPFPIPVNAPTTPMNPYQNHSVPPIAAPVALNASQNFPGQQPGASSAPPRPLNQSGINPAQSAGAGMPPGHIRGPSSPSPQVNRPSNPGAGPGVAPAPTPAPAAAPATAGGPAGLVNPNLNPYATVLFKPSAPTAAAKKFLKLYQPNEINRQQPPLAKGSFGVVYTGTVADRPGIKVVIKDQEVREPRSIEDWQHEIEVMHNNRNPHIAEIFGFGRVNNTLIIVMEYFAKGDLFGVLHKNAAKHPLSRLQRMRMARHVTMGLAFLHENGIMHRDIKSLNVLVGDDYSCKITDFGTAKLLGAGAAQHQMQVQTKGVGSPLWMAPEVAQSSNYGFAGDVYSLGVVLYEIFERAIPFDAKTSKIVFPENYASSIIVKPCLNPDPKQRPSTKDVLKFVDMSIKQTLAAVARVLPQQDQMTIGASIDRLKEQRETAKRNGTAPAMSDQQVQAEEVSDLLQTMYTHMLSKPPQEVDDLILRSAGK